MRNLARTLRNDDVDALVPTVDAAFDPTGDILEGTPAIAKWLGVSQKRAFYLRDTYAKLGDDAGFFTNGKSRVCLSKSAYRAFIAKKIRGGRP